jgi:hypothetical protein
VGGERGQQWPHTLKGNNMKVYKTVTKKAETTEQRIAKLEAELAELKESLEVKTITDSMENDVMYLAMSYDDTRLVYKDVDKSLFISFGSNYDGHIVCQAQYLSAENFDALGYKLIRPIKDSELSDLTGF